MYYKEIAAVLEVMVVGVLVDDRSDAVAAG